MARAFGVRGEMYVDLHASAPAAHLLHPQVYLGDTPFDVESRTPRRGGLVLKLRSIDTPEAVQPWLGLPVQVPEERIAPLPTDTYYHFQVIGLRVVTTDGRELGEVQEILEAPANDVYVVRGPGGEVLVPAIGDVIKKVDLARGVLIVQAIPGLLA